MYLIGVAKRDKISLSTGETEGRLNKNRKTEEDEEERLKCGVKRAESLKTYEVQKVTKTTSDFSTGT